MTMTDVVDGAVELFLWCLEKDVALYSQLQHS